jgi:hypothetical protein
MKICHECCLKRGIGLEGWKNVNHRPLIDILVSIPKGVMFLKFHGIARRNKDGPYLMGLSKEAIEEVGRESVVHGVTNNASNNVLIGGLINEEYSTFFGILVSYIASTSLKMSIHCMCWKNGK